MRNPNVSHLRMYQPMKNTSVDDCATADACAHGEIEKIGEILCCSPARLAESGGVHVGVETDRYAQSVSHCARKIVILPANLRSRRDIAKRQGSAMQVNRTKGTDANRPQFPSGLLAKELDRLGQRSVGGGGGKLDSR